MQVHRVTADCVLARAYIASHMISLAPRSARGSGRGCDGILRRRLADVSYKSPVRWAGLDYFPAQFPIIRTTRRQSQRQRAYKSFDADLRSSSPLLQREAPPEETQRGLCARTPSGWGLGERRGAAETMLPASRCPAFLRYKRWWAQPALSTPSARRAKSRPPECSRRPGRTLASRGAEGRAVPVGVGPELRL